MKKRLDVLVYEHGFAESREKAKSLIMEGYVYIDNQKADKPGMSYKDNANLEVRKNSPEFVSRGGLKLSKAIKEFNIDLSGLIAMDVGASTGGFTDCMLQNRCIHVYAVDVGYGQLAWKLRTDERVTNLERTNIRYINSELIKHSINFFSVDVSFISLCTVLPVIGEIIGDSATGVCLIKPQFEAGREKVGKKGVVRNKKVHIEVIEKICNFCKGNGFNILGMSYSPIKGPEGNIEYLIYLKKCQDVQEPMNFDIHNLVEKSHYDLNGGEFQIEDSLNSES